MIRQFLAKNQIKFVIKNNRQTFHLPEANYISDTYCQDSMADSLSYIQEIHQRTPKFAQSSIKMQQESVYSIKELAQDISLSIKNKPLLQASYSKYNQKKANDLEQTTKIPKNSRITNIESLVSELNATHKSMKLNLCKIKRQKENIEAIIRREEAATKPNSKYSAKHVNKTNKEVTQTYKVTGNMTQRYSERQAIKCKTETMKRLEKMEAQMKQCTFKPFLISERKSKDILALRDMSNRRDETITSRSKEKNQKKVRKIDNEISPRSPSPSFNYKHLKNAIKGQIKSLKLD